MKYKCLGFFIFSFLFKVNSFASEIRCSSQTYYSIPANIYVTTVPAVAEAMPKRTLAQYMLHSTGTSAQNYIYYQSTITMDGSASQVLFSSQTLTLDMDSTVTTTFYFILPAGTSPVGLTIRNRNCYK